MQPPQEKTKIEEILNDHQELIQKIDSDTKAKKLLTIC